MFYNMATITTSTSISTTATATTTATTQTGGIVKKPGPPVPPRPTASLIATTLRTTNSSINTQRNIISSTTASVTRNNYTNFTPAALTSFQANTTNQSKINAIKSSIEQQQKHNLNNIYNHNNNNTNNNQPPIIHKKPIINRQNSAGGRTVIYKSPSINMQQRQDQQQQQQKQQQQQQQQQNQIEGTSIQPAVRTSIVSKPPLKLRKAPDVPKPLAPTPSKEEIKNSPTCNKEDMKNVTTVANGIGLNRHNSMGCAGTPKTAVGLKETRLSLGRVDTNKYGKISVDQLQLSSQPLPKPRKIVQMPVATLDLDNKSTSSTMANIFRRSKTTLDNITNRANVTTVNTANSSSPNRFLGGRTVEFKNNLKNAAERLFAEMMVSQSHKQVTEPPPTIITKHERAIQHPTTLTSKQQTEEPQQKHQQQATTVTVAVNSKPSPFPAAAAAAASVAKVNVTQNNCTRISINGMDNSMVTTTTKNKKEQIESILNSPEKKTAFHEILISELAAMRAKSISMENLQTKTDPIFNGYSTPLKASKARDVNANMKSSSTDRHLRCNSEDEYEEEHEDDDDMHDNEDVDADNVEDVECDEEFLRKTLKLSTKNATRKRCPSGCSSDSSPYGTERSARIRTSDWIEVQDNGKEVTLTSCHISLEDSGLEDEERMDDISSGVGDSWDSVKESQNEQHCQNVKR